MESDKEQTTAAKRRVHKDRLGQIIIDPRVIEARDVQAALRRLTRVRIKGGLPPDVPVPDLAQAVGTTSVRIVEIVRDFDVWLWGLVEDGPIENWKVFEDGE